MISLALKWKLAAGSWSSRLAVKIRRDEMVSESKRPRDPLVRYPRRLITMIGQDVSWAICRVKSPNSFLRRP